MSTKSLPAISLRTGNRLPAAQVSLWVVNYMIYMVLWLIGPAISGREWSFLPALREAPGGVRRATRHAYARPRLLLAGEGQALTRKAVEPALAGASAGVQRKWPLRVALVCR